VKDQEEKLATKLLFWTALVIIFGTSVLLTEGLAEVFLMFALFVSHALLIGTAYSLGRLEQGSERD